MALKVSYHSPAFEKDDLADVGGIVVKNGGSTTLSAEDEERFVARHGMSVREYFKGSRQVKIEGASEVKTSNEGGE